jgi:hypothetical protein
VPDDLTLEEAEIRDAAIAYAGKQGKKIAKGLTDPAVYKPEGITRQRSTRTI